MKKRWMKVVSILCVVTLLVGILTACDGGDPQERKKKSENQTVAEDTPVVTPTTEATPMETTPTGEPTPEATPTEELTPTPEATPTEEPTPTPEATPTEELMPTPEATPTEEPTPTPETTPTDEPTPTPQVTPTELSFSTKTAVYTKEDGTFSVSLPEDAEVKEYDGGIVATTENAYFFVWYVNTFDDGVIYDANDCVALMKTEEDYKELLAVDAIRGVHEVEKTSLNGVICAGAAADTITVPFPDKTYSGRGWYCAYDCKFDPIGVYTVMFVLNGVNAGSEGQKEKELYELWLSCAKSLVQLETPMEYMYASTVVGMPDGTDMEFAYDMEELDRIDKDEDGDINLYFNPGTAESISIQHFVPQDGIKTAEDYYNAKRQKYSDEKFHYSEISEYAGRMKYQHWTLTYREAGDDYTEEVFIHVNEDGTMWLIVLLRYTEWEDDGALLLDDLLWTMREVGK